jgi:chromosomal replication initiator protein
LQKPDVETRVAIIKKKLNSEGIDVPQNVIDYIAESVNTNIRELDGVLATLVIQSVLCKTEIDINLAKSVLQNIIKDAVVDVNIEYIIKTICEYYRITPMK